MSCRPRPHSRSDECPVLTDFVTAFFGSSSQFGRSGRRDRGRSAWEAAAYQRQRHLLDRGDGRSWHDQAPNARSPAPLRVTGTRTHRSRERGSLSTSYGKSPRRPRAGGLDPIIAEGSSLPGERATQLSVLLGFRTDHAGRFRIQWSYGSGNGTQTYPLWLATPSSESDYPYTPRRPEPALADRRSGRSATLDGLTAGRASQSPTYRTLMVCTCLRLMSESNSVSTCRPRYRPYRTH